MRSQVFVFVVVLIFLGISVVAIQDVYQTEVREAGTQENIDNETFTVDIGNSTNLTESNVSNRVYDADVEVYNATDDTQLAEDEYVWNENGLGRINVTSTANVSNGSDANISYGYNVPTGAQDTAQTVSLLPAQIGESLGLILAFFVLVAVMVKVAS